MRFAARSTLDPYDSEMSPIEPGGLARVLTPPGVTDDGLAFSSIVHVNEKGGRFGGTEEYIDLITPELFRRGVRSHVVCGRVVGDLPAMVDSTLVIEGLADRTPGSGIPDAVSRAVGSLDADVVYLHNLFDPAVVTTLARSEPQAVVVWYVHDHYVTCLSELRWRHDHGACGERLGTGCLTAIDRGHCVLRYPDRAVGPGELRRRRALNASLGAVDAIIVVSDYMRRLLVDAQPELRQRIHLVPRPIRDLGAPPIRARAAHDPAVITFAGRVTPEKGLDVLIEALAACRSRAPIELRIAGAIEHPAYWRHCQTLLERATQRNLQLRFTTLGHLDYDGIDELFRASDIVVVPSQWPEPLGCVALEAMSAGAAVIASQIGGLAGSIKHAENGLLVRPAASQAWTAALDGLLDDPDRARRLGEHAARNRRRVSAAAHVETLDRIVRQARRRRRSA